MRLIALGLALLAFFLGLCGCSPALTATEKPTYEKKVAWQLDYLEIKSCKQELVYLEKNFALMCNNDTELQYVGPVVVYIETFRKRDWMDSDYLLCPTKLDRCLRTGFVSIN